MTFAFLTLALAASALAYFLLRTEPVTERYRSGPVERRMLVQVVEATGHLDATSRVEVPAPVDGRLVELLVAPGDGVERGQPLARLDDRAATLGVRGAAAARQAASWRATQARAAARSALRERQRVQALVQSGLASVKELAAASAMLEQARAAVKVAEADRALAAGNVASAGLQRDLAELVSPMQGIVLAAPDSVGITVAPNQGPLFVVASALDQMRIDAAVSEADIGQVREGQHAKFEVQTFPGRTFEAVVERIGLDGRREEAVVTYPVRLRADNPDRALRPGMTATVRITVGQVQNALAVREAALRFTPDGFDAAAPRTRVFRRAGADAIEAVVVEPGLSDGLYTEVRPVPPGALAPGDEVIVGRTQTAASLGDGPPGISLGKRK